MHALHNKCKLRKSRHFGINPCLFFINCYTCIKKHFYFKWLRYTEGVEFRFTISSSIFRQNNFCDCSSHLGDFKLWNLVFIHGSSLNFFCWYSYDFSFNLLLLAWFLYALQTFFENLFFNLYKIWNVLLYPRVLVLSINLSLSAFLAQSTSTYLVVGYGSIREYVRP